MGLVCCQSEKKGQNRTRRGGGAEPWRRAEVAEAEGLGKMAGGEAHPPSGPREG